MRRTKVKDNSQDRGNSGVIIPGPYAVQGLDSFENVTYPDGQVGARDGQLPSLVNAVKKPGTWQSCENITSSRGPIVLQDPGYPTCFRNIWIRPLGDYNRP